MAQVTQTDIFNRLIEAATLTPDAAKGLLALQFSEADHERMSALAEKSNNGDLSSDERAEFEAYVYVGTILSLLKSKARQSLRQAQIPAA